MTNKNPFPMIPIPKTPKCFIGGAFVRSESGRVTPLSAADGTFLCNIPLCSRKDLRNAVEAAAAASGKWAGTTPYLRGQILYRLAEMLDARAIEMTAALNVTDPAMEKNHRGNALEVRSTVERIVHFAGWTDKYLTSISPSSNPSALQALSLRTRHHSSDSSASSSRHSSPETRSWPSHPEHTPCPRSCSAKSSPPATSPPAR
jgi:hypothetical protein